MPAWLPREARPIFVTFVRLRQNSARTDSTSPVANSVRPRSQKAMIHEAFLHGYAGIGIGGIRGL